MVDFNIKYSWLTNIITPYFTYLDEIILRKKIPFIIRGALQWIPENSQINKDDLYLKSEFLELEGKNINDINGLKYHLQYTENMFEIHGIKDFVIDSDDKESAEDKLIESILEIFSFINIISLLNDAPVKFLPARILEFKQDEDLKKQIVRIPRSTEEMMSTRVNTNNIISCKDFSNQLNEMPQKLKEVVRRSIYWQSQGNQYDNSLTRFSSHWLSIEIIANYLFKKEKSDPYTLINKKIVSLNESSYKEIITKCYRILNPGVKEKIEYMLVFFKDADKYRNVLFEKDDECDLSPYDLRNKILHGSLTEYELEKTQLFGGIFYKMQQTSKKIIIELITNYDEMIKNFSVLKKLFNG